MMKALLELFVMYLLYKLIFEFIVPIYNTTKQVKQKVNEIHQNITDTNKQQNPTNSFTNIKTEATEKAKKDDYIEFEDI